MGLPKKSPAQRVWRVAGNRRRPVPPCHCFADHIKFEQFESIPLFEVFIEAILDPNIVNTRVFPGWNGGDIGHTWLVYACKTVDPCN